jgi:hypothetical protein
MMTEA